MPEEVGIAHEDAAQRKPRFVSLDALRIFGLAAIVFGHVWSNGFTSHWIFSWHVPLFFFLSGYLWTARRPFGVVLRKRAAALVLPYVTWLVLILAGFSIYLRIEHRFSLLNFVKTIYGGAYATRPFTAFWFVTVLFFAIILFRLIEPLPRWVAWIIAVAALALPVLWGNRLGHTPLGIGLALPCLVYVLAGAEFRRLGVERFWWRGLLGIALLALGAVSIATGLAGKTDIKGGSFGTPGFGVLTAIVICYGLLLVFDQAFSRVSPGVSRTITVLGMSGLAVVLGQAVIFQIMGTPPTGGILDFVLALCVPWIIGAVALLTPVSRFITGSPRLPQATRAPSPVVD